MSTTEYVESYLENAKSLRLRLMCEKEYLEQLENLVPDWMRKEAAYGSSIARLDDEIVRTKRSIGSLEDEIEAVAATFAELPEVERDVMRMRYLDGMRWRDITKKLYYSSGYVVGDMHRRCKKHLAELI